MNARADSDADRGRPRGASDTLARQAALVSVIALSFAFGGIVLWLASAAVLAVLIGIVVAVVLDSGARALAYVVPLPRHVRLVLVFVMVAAVLLGGIWIGGAAIASQAAALAARSKDLLSQMLAAMSNLPGPDRPAMDWLPSSESIFSGATNIATLSFGGLTTAVSILFLGAFFAWEPEIYKSGLLSLLTKEKRPRVDAALDEAAIAMRHWLIGQSISMALIAVFTYAALHVIAMPYPLVLALLSGLLAFVPTVGPFISGIVIVWVGLAESTAMAFYGAVTYAAIQLLETNIVTPLVQGQTIHLPPGLMLGVQLIAGTLFGLPGLAFAVPLAAAAQVLVSELYVKDRLGGAWHPRPSEAER